MTINYSHVRELMVEQQIRPWDVLDFRVLDVLATLPRENYLPDAYRALAYADLEIPLGHGQKMMKPVVEGRTLQALLLEPGEEVLEIGTGSGYLSACLGALAREVVSLEINPELASRARAQLDASGHGSNIRIENVDALHYQTDRRFDAICVTGAMEALPSQFLPWLRPQGRPFGARGHSPVMEAVLVHNDVNGPRIESLFETDLPYLVGAAPTPQFVF